jgi:Fic family protein
MKTPPDPPSCEVGINNDALAQINTPEMRELVRRINAKYLYWDKARYYATSAGIDPELAWAAVKISRSDREDLPIALEFGMKLNYWIPQRHHRLLHEIDRQAGGQISSNSPIGVAAADRDRYLINSLMEEAIASSQLEGATTTREVAKRMLRQNRRPRDSAEQMILNNYRAIMKIRDLTDEELRPEVICQIQKIITSKTLSDPTAAGRFRRPEESVVVSDSETGDVIHRPPPSTELDNRVRELCEFTNSDEPFVHPVIKAIAIHFTLGFIHPFVDGNGRTARALFYWYMLKSGCWLFEYLPISRIFLRGPIAYSKAYCYTEKDEGDLTYFIDRNLSVIDTALRDLHDYLEQQQRELKRVEAFLSSNTWINHRQANVITACIKDHTRGFTVAEHATTHHVTKATARSDLLELVERGWLEKRKVGRKWVFTPVQHIAKRIAKAAGASGSLELDGETGPMIVSGNVTFGGSPPPPPPTSIN